MLRPRVWKGLTVQTPRHVDPQWWRSASHDGQALPAILRRRDIGTLFRFLRSRGFSRAAIAAATGLSETRVRSVAQGRQQITSYEVLERIAAGLGIPRGSLGLAYHPHDVPVAAGGGVGLVDPSECSDYVAALAALAVGAPPGNIDHLLPPAPPAPADLPPVVTMAQVRVLREVCERHRQFDAEQGGGSCRDSAAGYLRWARGLLGCRCDSDATTVALVAALADMFQVVGWACHDLGDHAAARRHLVAGLRLARQVNDLVLVAGAFYRLGRVSIHQGRAQEALKLWQLGQIVAQDSGCLVSVAVLHANEAWAYAQVGAPDRVRDALARAQGELGRVDARSVPSWARFFLSPADLDGLSAVAYASLAAHAQHRDRYATTVIDHAQRALAHRQPGETRSATFDAISLATGYALDHQPDLLARHGHHAVDLATDGASQRAHDRLHTMAALASGNQHHDGVAALLGRVRALPPLPAARR